MSKVILVIELDDEWLNRINTTCDEILADVTLYKKESLENQCDYSQRIYRCWCPLKPMPQKNKYDVDIYATVDYENNVTFGHYLNIGWNNCIDEILGEKNESSN